MEVYINDEVLLEMKKRNLMQQYEKVEEYIKNDNLK